MRPAGETGVLRSQRASRDHGIPKRYALVRVRSPLLGLAAPLSASPRKGVPTRRVKSK